MKHQKQEQDNNPLSQHNLVIAQAKSIFGATTLEAAIGLLTEEFRKAETASEPKEYERLGNILQGMTTAYNIVTGKMKLSKEEALQGIDLYEQQQSSQNER